MSPTPQPVTRLSDISHDAMGAVITSTPFAWTQTVSRIDDSANGGEPSYERKFSLVPRDIWRIKELSLTFLSRSPTPSDFSDLHSPTCKVIDPAGDIETIVKNEIVADVGTWMQLRLIKHAREMQTYAGQGHQQIQELNLCSDPRKARAWSITGLSLIGEHVYPELRFDVVDGDGLKLKFRFEPFERSILTFRMPSVSLEVTAESGIMEKTVVRTGGRALRQYRALLEHLNFRAG